MLKSIQKFSHMDEDVSLSILIYFIKEANSFVCIGALYQELLADIEKFLISKLVHLLRKAIGHHY